MKHVFFIVGPTATGKSELAAEAAQRLGAEVVSADAFQIYRGLDLLTAKPDASILTKATHHLLGAVPLSEEMNVEKYRAGAVEAIRHIHGHGKPAIVVGGSGLYIKALTHGLSKLPGANWGLREKLDQRTVEELYARLCDLDSQTAARIDRKNKRRLIRAVEICLLTGKPFSVAAAAGTGVRAARSTGILPVGPTGVPPVIPSAPGKMPGVPTGSPRDESVRLADKMPVLRAADPTGVFVFRDRADLYDRINRRVEKMFADGVVEEVRSLSAVGSTAEKALGLQEIQLFVTGKISEQECIATIQQATRHYAKRQLTWFERQTSFEPLNLSLHGTSAAIEWICQKARLSFAHD